MFEPVHHRSEIDLDRTMVGKQEERTLNVGLAVLLTAIEDMKRAGELGASAHRFLYPATPEHRERLIWAVQVAGVSTSWLQEKLATAKRRVQ